MANPQQSLCLLNWNVERPSKDRSAVAIVAELTAMLVTYAPDVVSLQEISACRRQLRQIPGYKLLEYDDRSGGDNAFLVRDGLGHGAGWDIEVDGDNGYYYTTNDRKVWGRSHVTVKVEWLRLTNVHFPPAVDFRNNKGIGAARRVAVYGVQLIQLDRNVRAFRSDPAHAVVGDWNERSADNGVLSPGGWARRAGVPPLAGTGIDWIGGRGFTVRVVKIIPKGSAGNRSDHPAQVFDLTPIAATPKPTPDPVPTPAPTPPKEAPVVVRKAKAIDLLFTEMNTRFPKRTKVSDGWLGDAAHRSRTSDHNAWIVDPSGDRIVSAADITEDAEGGFSEIVDFMVKTLVDRRDERVKYIIHEGKIWRSYDKPGIPAWTPARYTGPNGHFKHGHVSVKPEKRFYDSTKPWGLLVAKIYQPGERDLVYREGRDVMNGPDVKFVQEKIGMGAQDGYYGPKTAAQVKAWEKQHNSRKQPPKLLADGIVGTGTWRAFGVEPKYKAK